MTTSSSLSVIYSLNPLPKPITTSSKLKPSSISIVRKSERRNSFTKQKAAGLSEIEPDLNEDPRDRWALNSVDEDDFVYGKYDGAHTYYEGDQEKGPNAVKVVILALSIFSGTFWGEVAEAYASMEPPSGFQGIISWLFPPAIVAGMYFDAPGEYLYIGAALFVIVFCIIEMGKPSKPHNFEPQIYNMERGARDKLIADYNSMSIWDFNEKYGDLWDFTETKNIDEIMQR